MATQPVLKEDGPAVARAGLVHRVRQPAGSGPHPTVLLLHGWRGDEDVMWIFARTLPRDWLLVAPRATLADPLGGFTWHRHAADAGWPTISQFDAASVAVMHFVRALPHLYGADLSRIYAMGFSQGAALSFTLALQHPGFLQGIAGLVGFVPLETAPLLAEAPLLETPVFMAAGREDERVPIELARRSADVLRQAEADLTYREYDTGHKLNSAGMRDLAGWWEERR